MRPSAPTGFTAGAYFIGKALWGKGYTELLALLAAHKAATGVALRVDAYGAGEDAEDIRAQARAVSVPILDLNVEYSVQIVLQEACRCAVDMGEAA